MQRANASTNNARGISAAHKGAQKKRLSLHPGWGGRVKAFLRHPVQRSVMIHETCRSALEVARVHMKRGVCVDVDVFGGAICFMCRREVRARGERTLIREQGRVESRAIPTVCFCCCCVQALLSDERSPLAWLPGGYEDQVMCATPPRFSA